MFKFMPAAEHRYTEEILRRINIDKTKHTKKTRRRISIDKDKIGTYGWYGLIIYVIAWDVTARETLTDAFDRGMNHPVIRWIACILWGLVTAHLFRVIPKHYDPLFRVTEYIAKKYGY